MNEESQKQLQEIVTVCRESPAILASLHKYLREQAWVSEQEESCIFLSQEVQMELYAMFEVDIDDDDQLVLIRNVGDVGYSVVSQLKGSVFGSAERRVLDYLFLDVEGNTVLSKPHSVTEAMASRPNSGDPDSNVESNANSRKLSLKTTGAKLKKILSQSPRKHKPFGFKSPRSSPRGSPRENRHASDRPDLRPLEEMLAEPNNRFIDFVKAEHAHENVLFYQAVSSLNSSSVGEFRVRAAQIYVDFISEDAAHQVNISSEIRSCFDSYFPEIPRQVYDAMQKSVFDLMKRDSYSRYCLAEKREFTKKQQEQKVKKTQRKSGAPRVPPKPKIKMSKTRSNTSGKATQQVDTRVERKGVASAPIPE